MGLYIYKKNPIIFLFGWGCIFTTSPHQRETHGSHKSNTPVICLRNASHKSNTPVICLRNANHKTHAPVICLRNASHKSNHPVVCLRNASHKSNTPVICLRNAVINRIIQTWMGLYIYNLPPSTRNTWQS